MKKCSKPEQCETYFIKKHGAIGCLYCNEWITEACEDPSCKECKNRPETPNEYIEKMIRRRRKK